MEFNSANLKTCAQTGQELGYWKGTVVKSISKRNILKTQSNVYYILFDDGNKLYRDGKIYGWVTKQGSVMEDNYPTQYRRPYEVVYEEPKKEKVEIVTEDNDDIDKIIEDGKNILTDIEKSVNKMLEEVCKWD